MAKQKPTKPRLPPIYAEEQRQIDIRRKQEFPLAVDEYGRQRIPVGTQDGQRAYDRSTGGIIRLRTADPLKVITGLSPRQRNAGTRFRTDYDIAATSGIKPASMAERVDSSGLPRGAPAHVLDAFRAMGEAREALGHHEIAMVVECVCGQRMSIREIAGRTKDPRPALAKLLSIGLDHLADHYFGKVKPTGKVVSVR